METFKIGGKVANFFDSLGNKIESTFEKLGDDILHGIEDVGDFGTKLVREGKDIINTTDDFVNKNLINEVKNFPAKLKEVSKIVSTVEDSFEQLGSDIRDLDGKFISIGNTIEHDIKNSTKGAGKFIKDAVGSVKDEILSVTREIKDTSDNAKKMLTKTIKEVEAAGLKIGKEIEQGINKAVDFAKKEEKLIENKVKKGINQITDKLKAFGKLFGDWYQLILDYINAFLNSIIEYIETVYFVYTFCGYWIALTLLFVLYGMISIWSVFGEFNTTARYIIFYSIMYYLYTLDYFTLHLTLDPKEMINNFIDFFKNFSSNIQGYWKKFDEDIRWFYFIFVSYFYAILISFLILITGFVVPVFDVTGKEFSIYLRNIAFYAIMYYMYNNQMFSLKAVDNPVKAVEDFFKNLSNPQSFFKNLGDGVLKIIADIFFVILFVIYWVMLTAVFMTYDSFNIWEVFGDYSWYAKNSAFYGIMYALYSNGYMDITKSVNEMYTTLTTTSWSDLLNSCVLTFQLIYFIVMSFGFAIIISTLIIFLSLTSLFNILGDDNSIYLRNVFFYVMLAIIYNDGYMTLPSTKDIDIWSLFKNIRP